MLYREPNALQIRVSLVEMRPPEDVGGPARYANFLEIMADPAHPEHADTKRWCGGHFDPDWFDLETTNKDVRSAL